ncbi:PTS system 2-O-a-mannosyl-D-glycerate specific transporter subunit IIABC [Roseimaritima multifibrata]|uniref:PTS system 2-O-a-mannosyl-D-glycerate specific transporter subunit IIABC n=1 Tax=Roseimaritima multifibrata TaxID=1930274 RepID=A0A517MLH8_9BACT|nr:PTS sugar transporter subunit IIA [Roseimaritima multifibrata]QDS95741.1 PTS system 2-O-a-mannosyl-D-glycerate specific transporter subunit IIABC [Roseimaritima multifibrata]
MEDFDVGHLAAFLHLTPDQVIKLAERGKLPGRRVQGEWRFAEAEIHHYMEDRIGDSDEAELGVVENLLHRTKTADEPIGRIVDLCPEEGIAVPLNARTKGSVIRAMADLAGATGLLWDAPAMAEAVRQREDLHPTALDCGVALLHPRRPQTSILAQSLLAIGVCSAPLPFSDQGHLTDVFFLVCSYDDRSHLKILARLSRLISDGECLPRIREAQSPAEIRDALLAAEELIEESE